MALIGTLPLIVAAMHVAWFLRPAARRPFAGRPASYNSAIIPGVAPSPKETARSARWTVASAPGAVARGVALTPTPEDWRCEFGPECAQSLIAPQRDGPSPHSQARGAEAAEIFCRDVTRCPTGKSGLSGRHLPVSGTNAPGQPAVQSER